MADFTRLRRTMVDTQVRPSDVTKFPIIDAMLRTPREAYVPPPLKNVAYADGVAHLGAGRFMLDPRGFAKMLDAANVQPTDLVLDIGCGLGYSAAVLGHMAEAVVAVEEEGLAAEAEATLTEQGTPNVAVITGALAEGAAKHAPFDLIFIEGAVQQIPLALQDQLAEGGRIIAIFEDAGTSAVRLGQKNRGAVSWRFVCNASASVLTGFEKTSEFAL